jgi:uncharacterized membrane protein YesL
MSGLFGQSRFTKETPERVKEPLPKKGLPLFFYLYFRSFWKLVKLNLLFLIFCIPVITIPAAITALMSVTNNIFQEKLTFIWIDFYKAFKENFVRSLVYGLLWLIAAGVVLLSASVSLRQLEINAMFMITLMVAAVFMFLLLLVNQYCYLMIAIIDLPLKKTMRNSLALGIMGIKRNAIVLLISAGILFLIVYFLPFTIILILFWLFSMLSSIICFGLHGVVHTHIISPYETKHGKPQSPAEGIQPIFKD